MAYGVLQIQGSYIPGVQDLVEYFLGGGTFAARDFVMPSSGEMVVATATNKIGGVALEAGTSSSEDVAVNTTPGMMIIMDNDNLVTTFAVTHVGTKFDFIGATGAMLVDTSSTSTTGQLYCKKYNPQGVGYDSDTSIGQFIIDERTVGI